MSSPLCPDTEVCMADDPVIIYPKWQTELMAALAETNPNNLLERVKEAEKAIAKRFGRISRSTSHAAEIEAIEKAMDALEVLTRKASQPKAS
jgi:5,10-methenyltetrahydromethanopterin hydrogenase